MGAGLRLTGEARLSDLAGKVDCDAARWRDSTEGRGGSAGFSDSSSWSVIRCDVSESCETSL